MMIALLMALGLNYFSYWYSDKMAQAVSRARQVSSSQVPELHNMVSSLASRAGLPKPRVYIIEQSTPNAFATGRNPQNAAVAVTIGLMQILNNSELEGVIAHELGHTH